MRGIFPLVSPAFRRTVLRMNPSRLFALSLWLMASVVRAEPGQVETTPKLENLNKQIAANAEDSQAYSNRGYTLALLGRKDEARADIQKSVALKDSGPMHNRAGWAYFNLGDYAEAVREFELAVKMSGSKSHYDFYSLLLGYWGAGRTKEALENYQLAVERDPRFGEYKTLAERTAEWTPLERRAIHEIYVLWSKAWRP
jgi:tetratricopeptide (TPR) repeat protein